MTKNIIIAFLLVVDVFMLLFLLRTSDSSVETGRNYYVLQQLAYDYRRIIQSDSVRKIPSDLIIISTSKDTISIDSVVNNTPKLIIRYSSLNCHTCIDSLVQNAKQVSQLLGRDNICLFANYNSESDFRQFWRTNNLYFRIYSVESKIINADDFDTPYMFVLNPDHTISHLFIPHKTIPEMTKWYLDIICDYLTSFQKEQ